MITYTSSGQQQNPRAGLPVYEIPVVGVARLGSSRLSQVLHIALVREPSKAPDPPGVSVSLPQGRPLSRRPELFGNGPERDGVREDPVVVVVRMEADLAVRDASCFVVNRAGAFDGHAAISVSPVAISLGRC